MNKASHTIGWCDVTWNPITGCLNSCPYCYARKGYKRFKRSFNPQIHYDRLGEPLKLKKPSRIFVCSVSDFWGEGVKQIWREEVYNIIKACPSHTFQMLTKKPENITEQDIEHCPEENVWIGTTNTGGEFKSIYDLTSLPINNLKFISFEPLLRPMVGFLHKEIKWVILGSQTQPFKPPAVKWVKDIVDEAREIGAKIYMKSNLKKVWEGELIQEFPKRI